MNTGYGAVAAVLFLACTTAPLSAAPSVAVLVR
jgi:hypothetical protein